MCAEYRRTVLLSITGGGKQNVVDIIFGKNEIEDWNNSFHNMFQIYNVVTQEFLVCYTVISVTFTTEFLVHFFAHKAVFKTRHVMTAPSLTKHASLSKWKFIFFVKLSL